MTDRLEALATEFDKYAEESRELDDHSHADAFEYTARRVREVAAELAPELLPRLDTDSDAVPAELDDPTPIHDDVHAQVYGDGQ